MDFESCVRLIQQQYQMVLKILKSKLQKQIIFEPWQKFFNTKFFKLKILIIYTIAFIIITLGPQNGVIATDLDILIYHIIKSIQ